MQNFGLIPLHRIPFVLDIEGLIGSGKTTLIEKCLVPFFESKGLSVTVIREPVDQWGELLPLFYKDPAKYAYLFQTMAFHDRVRESQDKWGEYSDTTDIFITERGALSDTLFVKSLHEQKLMSDVEVKCYMKWWNLWSDVIPFKPDLFVYLSPSMDTIMDRVKKRSRPGEEGISLDYQLILKKYHDDLFDSNSKEHIIVHKIDSDVDFGKEFGSIESDDITNELNKLYKQICIVNASRSYCGAQNF